MKTCCEKNGMKHGCDKGHKCTEPMVDGGNFWYQPQPIPNQMQTTFAERLLIAIVFAMCFGVLYGAVRYYGALAFGWPI